MKKVKNTISAAAGLSLLAVSNTALAVSSRINDSSAFKNGSGDELQTSWLGLDSVIGNMIVWISGFLYFAAVIMGLWGAYNILTAGGDEEKVKKGKDIIIRAVLWIIAVFLVSIIMNFVISSIFTAWNAK